MKRTTLRRSSSLKPTGRQMRVLKLEYLESGEAMQPSPSSTSIRVLASSPGAGGPSASPTYSAECDQVDCVRYLMISDMRWLPATSSTSPGCNARRRSEL